MAPRKRKAKQQQPTSKVPRNEEQLVQTNDSSLPFDPSPTTSGPYDSSLPVDPSPTTSGPYEDSAPGKSDSGQRRPPSEVALNANQSPGT